MTGGWKPTHRHVKTGGLYRVLGTALIEATMERAVIYEEAPGHTVRGERLWVRPFKEFHDGRFEAVEPSQPQGTLTREELIQELYAYADLPHYANGAPVFRAAAAALAGLDAGERDVKAEAALKRLQVREGESVEEWAAQLAGDLVAAGEAEYCKPSPSTLTRLQAELSQKDEEIERLKKQLEEIGNYYIIRKDCQDALKASTQREAALREALVEMVQQFKGQVRRDAWEFEIGFDAAKEAIAKARAALADRGEG